MQVYCLVLLILVLLVKVMTSFDMILKILQIMNYKL